MQGHIYKIKNLINGKLYIGQTKGNILVRLKEHARTRSIIGAAIRKYGIDNFSIEIIENVDDSLNIDDRERYWINFYDSLINHNGYNVSTGGQGVHGYQHTEKTKEIISKNSAGRKRIHRESINKLVKSEDYKYFLENGWLPGWHYDKNFLKAQPRRNKLSKSQLHRKSFTNGLEEIHLKPDQIDEYVKKGYEPGKLINGIAVTKITITNGKEDKIVTSSKLAYYLERKWVEGTKEDFDITSQEKIFDEYMEHKIKIIEDRKKKFSQARMGHPVSASTREKLRLAASRQEHSPERNKKISLALTGRKKGALNQSTKDKLSKSNKGKVIVNDGFKETSIHKDDLEIYISNGYLRGHIKGKQKSLNSIWINNGIINKRIDKNLLESFIKLGFRQGRMKK